MGVNSFRRRFTLGFTVLSASAALASLAACVGDDPVTVDPVPSEASTPTPGQEAGPGPGPGVDSSVPDGGVDSGPKRFCDTQAPLTGVTDFFCADFDGAKADEGFTKAILPDGGAVKLDTSGFFSPPASLLTTNDATLLWEKVGAAPFLEIDAHVRVNVGALGGPVAPSTAYLTILKLQSIDTTVELSFTAGGMVEGATYTGYYVTAVFCPGPCGIQQKKLNTSLPTNVWTDVEMLWQKTGGVSVLFNGLNVMPDPITAASTTSTKVSATLGAVAVGGPVGIGRHTYDNLVVAVKR